MRPLVSVIIPTYNRLKLLKEAIYSVENQSFKDFELIIVDDGSTDGTVEWLRQNYYKSLFLRHKGLPGRARNRGARLAKGKYLAFLDSDDLWLAPKLKLQLEFFEKNQNFKICHTREIWERDGKIVSQAGQNHRRSGFIFKDALHKCIIGPSTVMLEKRLFWTLGGFTEELEIAEDYELWLRLTAREQVGYLDIPLVIKRAGYGEQLSAKYGQIEIFRINALMKTLTNHFWNGEEKKLLKAELAFKCLIYARGAEKRGKIKEALKYKRLSAKLEASLQKIKD